MSPADLIAMYQRLVLPLPAPARRQLMALIVDGLQDEEASSEPADWLTLKGVAPSLLEGRDAPDWVTDSRSSADLHRQDAIGLA
jgi:hypothetical protein